MSDGRVIPILGEVSLEYVQWLEHILDGGFVATRVLGLAGELQQRSGRPSHRIHLAGVLLGEGAADDLGTLQNVAATGDELTFSADITTALDLQRVVVTDFRAGEQAGWPGRFAYELWLAESPPLPPPAEVSGFGGLDDFGLGDLGIDDGVLGDIQDAAGEVAGAVDSAMDTVSRLGALAGGLADLGSAEGLLQPLGSAVDGLRRIGGDLSQATGSLGEVLG